MKKAISILLCIMMLLPASVFAAGEADTPAFDVYMDGVKITFPDEGAFVTLGKRLYIPIRALYGHMGYEVSWSAEANTVIAQKGEEVLQIPVGSKTVLLNGEKKTGDISVINKNGRTCISAKQLTICHGYYLRWDDINSRLDVMSPRYLGEQLLFAQSTFSGANATKPDYEIFNSMAEPVFLIPGLNEYVVPQGITYSEKTNCFYLSGYFKQSVLRSVICVVDAATGKAIGEYSLNHIDGKPHYGHVGGIAVSDKDIYIAYEQTVQRISLDAIEKAGAKGDLQVEENIKLYGGSSAGNSFLDCSGGYLWAGNYYDPDGYESTANENYTSLIRGYKLDPAQPSGISAELKTRCTAAYDYVPSVIYNVDEGRIQGMTTTDNYLILAASKSTKFSYLYVYDRTRLNSPHSSIVFDRDRLVPVYRLPIQKSVYAIPRVEEIVAVGDSIYATFESGAIIYRGASEGCATDSVWKIDINKLIGMQFE